MILKMGGLVVHWELMAFLLKETHAYTFVMKALILVVRLLESARVMVAGVVVMLLVTEVGCCR